MSQSESKLDIAALKRAINDSEKRLESTRRTASELEQKLKASEEKHWVYRMMQSREGEEKETGSSDEQRAA